MQEHPRAEFGDDIDALLASDRLEVSAGLFVDVFDGLVEEPLPRVALKVVAGRVAARFAIEWKHSRFLAGLPRTRREATVLRATLDVVLGWEVAGLASRLGDSEDDGTTKVVLTLAGEFLLRGDDVLARVLEVLERRDGRRSFTEL